MDVNEMKNDKDFDGKEIKSYIGFECCDQLTVGELKKRLEQYPDDTKVYIEASNAYNRNNTSWAQSALDTYPCKEDGADKKALMIVGTLK